jgi:hypothetical protein
VYPASRICAEPSEDFCANCAGLCGCIISWVYGEARLNDLAHGIRNCFSGECSVCSYIKSIDLRSGAYAGKESLVQGQINVQAWMGTLRNIRYPHSPPRHLPTKTSSDH